METAPGRIGLPTLYDLCLSPPPGKVAGILGPGACRLALRALARPLLSGEPVVAVDGGNRFDPYEVARAERALGGSGREALSRLLVSRAFTCHQLEALLARRLPAALSRSRARVALVLGFPETFADGDVPYPEACRVFRSCLSALRRLSREGIRVVVTGEGATGPGGGHSFNRTAGNLKGCPPKALPPREVPFPDNPLIARPGFFRYLARTSDPLLMLTGWRGTLFPSGRAGGGHTFPSSRGRTRYVPLKPER